jgi:ribonuclease HII
MKIGIDEVGRGCLAGPVVVAAALIPDEKKFIRVFTEAGMPELRDSKKMTPRAREIWYRWMKEEGAERSGVLWCFSKALPRTIDKINISASANKAAYAAFSRVVPEGSVTVRIDGGLYLRSKYFQISNFGEGRIKVTTLPKSDNEAIEVKLASVMAKVYRDRMMMKLHELYPRYGFRNHKGYGTREHREALLENGPIEGVHRKTFISSLIDSGQYIAGKY